MKAAISAGVPGVGSTLAARNLACTSGILMISATALAISACSAGDVFGGAASPNQPVETSPGRPASAEVGISGSVGARLLSRTATGHCSRAMLSREVGAAQLDARRAVLGAAKRRPTDSGVA